MASYSSYAPYAPTTQSADAFPRADPYYAMYSWPDPSSTLDATQTPLYVSRPRQEKFVESMAQRRERVEFLRRKEWTRRISEWIAHSASPEAKQFAHLSHSWIDILAAADADDEYACAHNYTPCEPPSPEEPYVIYTATPRSAATCRDDTPVPTHTHTPPSSPYPPPQPVQRPRPARNPRSRHSSLSSISEEDETALGL